MVFQGDLWKEWYPGLGTDVAGHKMIFEVNVILHPRLFEV